MLEFLKRLLELRKLDVEGPNLCRVVTRQVSAQQITAFAAPTTTVRDMLCALVEEGRVEMSSKSSRMMRFRLAEARVAASQSDQGGGETAVTSVATFPVTRTLNGNLCGYDSTLTRHRALAMLARQRG